MRRVISRVGLLLVAIVALSRTDARAQSLGAAGPQIGLKNLKFEPGKAKAKVKQQITFVWKEKVSHNIVFDNKGPKSKLQTKGVWLVSFAQPGTYKYKCSIHPGMKGEVAVS